MLKDYYFFKQSKEIGGDEGILQEVLEMNEFIFFDQMHSFSKIFYCAFFFLLYFFNPKN